MQNNLARAQGVGILCTEFRIQSYELRDVDDVSRNS
jgi:hypothetical protein